MSNGNVRFPFGEADAGGRDIHGAGGGALAGGESLEGLAGDAGDDLEVLVDVQHG
jgi:hypothetical protein